MTALCSVLVLCALTFVPVLQSPAPAPQQPGTSRRSKVQQVVSSLVYTPNWRNRRFVVWTLAIPLALFGYFVPYCHLPQFAKNIPLALFGYFVPYCHLPQFA